MALQLQLNAPGEGTRFKGFYGLNNRQMPLLIGEGRIPLSVAGLMSRYLEVLELYKDAPEELKPTYASLLRAWEDNSFDTGDGAARHHNERMKVVPDAQYLRLLTPETRLVISVVDLSDGYATLAGVGFSKAQVNKYCWVYSSRSDAKKNPVLLALARGDNALLYEFVDARFARAKERFGYEGEMMMIEAPTAPYEGAAGSLWRVCALNDVIDRSRVSGGVFLGGYVIGSSEPVAVRGDDVSSTWAKAAALPARLGGCGVLVGLVPEAQRAVAGRRRQTLEQRV